MANEKRLIYVNEPLREIQKEIEKVQEWRDKKANRKDAVLFIDEIYKLDNWLGVYAECADLIAEAPTVDAIPVSEIEAYLQARLDEWEALGDRKWEPANMWGYNFIMACFDDLERRREDGK